MTKRILVTGGCGFLGSALVRRLVADGHSVRVIDNESRGLRRRRVDGAEYEKRDITYDHDVDIACDGIDTVFHLAAINGTRHFYDRPADVLDVQIRGTLNVLDACRANGVKELVLFSSSEVYGNPLQIPTPENEPLKIADPLNPRFSYAGSKIAAELMCLHAPHLDRVLVIRPHNIYGPDMGEDHVIPELIRRLDATRGSDSIEVANPDATRAFCYVDDFIDGVLTAWQKGEQRGIYHVGTEQEIPIGSLAVLLSRVMRCERSIVTPRPGAPGGPRRRCPDTRKLRALGWSPKMTLKEGLRRTVAWYIENPKEPHG